MKRDGTLSINDTTIGVWENNVDEEMHGVVYGPLIKFLRFRGFSIHRNPEIKKRSRCISQNYHKGKKGDLEVLVELSGRYLKVDFFQNINFENPNGGQYDFNRFEKMPYLLRKRFLIEASAVLIHFFCKHGYQQEKQLGGWSVCHIIKKLRGINPGKEPLKRFNDSWGADRFKRDENGWPVQSELGQYYSRDREGVVLSTGMFRWWRDRRGYLKRGAIFPNMNSMWQIVCGPNKDDNYWVSAGHLFSLQPADCRRRKISDDARKKRLEETLDKAVKEIDFERAAVLRDILYGEIFKNKADLG